MASGARSAGRSMRCPRRTKPGTAADRDRGRSTSGASELVTSTRQIPPNQDLASLARREPGLPLPSAAVPVDVADDGNRARRPKSSYELAFRIDHLSRNL